MTPDAASVFNLSPQLLPLPDASWFWLIYPSTQLGQHFYLCLSQSSWGSQPPTKHLRIA